MLRNACIAGLVVCFIALVPAEARITKIEITGTSEPAPDGYVTVRGAAYGEVDPAHPLNAIIQDIELAPRNQRGMVEYSMNFRIQKPPGGGSRLLFYDVVNRGFAFNDIAASVREVGNLLRQRGYTVVNSGWQGDQVQLPNPFHFTLQVPVATNNGQEITGRVRMTYLPEMQSSTVLLASTFGFPLKSYEPVDLNDTNSVLTRFSRVDGSSEDVPRNEWAFANCSETPFPGVTSANNLCLKDGFDPRYIYELIYTAKDPKVLGLGFAATRDFVSFLRHETVDDSGTPNPLAQTPSAAIMHGHSQSSFFMKSFLHLGFNQDEAGRVVFEGMNPNIGPGRSPLNVRFGIGAGAGPGLRLGPNMASPTSWMPQYDPVAERAGWLLERCTETNSCPKVIQTVSACEYWVMRGSLNTTDSLGQYDAWIPRDVRMYFFSSAQHTPATNLGPGICQQLANPNDWVPHLRALLVGLENWVLGDQEPPPSQIPLLRNGSLVAADKTGTGWTDIPGVTYTGRAKAEEHADFGPEFNANDVSGVFKQPPTPLAGEDYAVLVPKVDEDNNDVAGIRSVAIQAPLGTYTGWNLRREGYGKDDSCGLIGSYIPFAETKAEREATGDPRLSVEERYGDHEGYVDAVREAVNRLVTQRFLLPGDAAALIKKAEDSDVLVPDDNQPPVAVAEPVSMETFQIENSLDGTMSTDPEGQPLTYSWKVTGKSASIVGADTATPLVQCGSGPGDYTFELTVTDSQGASDTATATLTYKGM